LITNDLEAKVLQVKELGAIFGGFGLVLVQNSANRDGHFETQPPASVGIALFCSLVKA
jgi:hypothetical protein